jgi:hypothetical protein
MPELTALLVGQLIAVPLEIAYESSHSMTLKDIWIAGDAS